MTDFRLILLDHITYEVAKRKRNHISNTSFKKYIRGKNNAFQISAGTTDCQHYRLLAQLYSFFENEILQEKCQFYNPITIPLQPPPFKTDSYRFKTIASTGHVCAARIIPDSPLLAMLLLLSAAQKLTIDFKRVNETPTDGA